MTRAEVVVKKLLFICSKNRLRSPTAEQVFSREPGVESASAGISRDADEPVSPYLPPDERVKL